MNELNLSPDFIKNIHSSFGEEGKTFIENLPDLIEQACVRWGLRDVQPVSNLSYNFVAFAKQVSVGLDTALHRTQWVQCTPLEKHSGLLDQQFNSQDVVLKIGVPHKELNSEFAALKLFNGEGICQLLESDEEHGSALLERLKPGTMLSELEDDDECMHIAVDVMQNLVFRRGGVTPPLQDKFIKLSDWFDGLKNVCTRFNGGTGPFPKEIFERVESYLPELLADKDVRLMHGDFHHFNILKSERGWLAIDPKGVIGPVGYEIGPLMINPWGSFSDWNSFQIMSKRRVSILSERLGWEREQIIQWAMAHAILSAWWDYDSLDWEYSLNCAKVFSEMK